jgi:translation initiation factor IF-1
MSKKKILQSQSESLQLIDEEIGRISCSLGNNLFECELKDKKVVVQLIPKLVKTIWIKKKSFVLVSLYEGQGLKVGGEIVRVLFSEDIKMLKKEGRWPSELEIGLEDSLVIGADDGDSPEDLLQDNPNHVQTSSDED